MATPRRSWRRRLLRWTGLGLSLLLVLVALAAGWGWTRLRASLPFLEGERHLSGLTAPVVVERDGQGVPTITGRTRLDVARATGFLHAQERFFQMDLLRRRAAGELAELVGARALPVDRQTRRHRFRALAARTFERLPSPEQSLLGAYAGGVNAGLAALGERPFEYLVLRSEPAPWSPEDSLLVVLAMFIDLNGEDGSREAALTALHGAVPQPVFDFLAPVGGTWDAPITGEPRPAAALPGPQVLDLRRVAWEPDPQRGARAAAEALATLVSADGDRQVGSNNWAVDGKRSAHGGALVADDMHLRLAVPNIWYRASLVWSDGERERRITGVTLPGVPAVVAGSNGDVAWGFTNSYGDWQDLVVLEPAGEDAYRTPDGPRRYEHVREELRVRGEPSEALEVLDTIWGPVIDTDGAGARRALAWTAHRAGGVGLGLLGLEHATTLEEALAQANRSGIPPQNFVCADRQGRIGWTIAGALPRRVGFDGRLATSWADGTRRWDGLRPPEETPRLVDPGSGRLWTANTRVVDGPALALIGDGGYGLGARARQIRDDLLAQEKLSERDLLAIQLDDRALFLERWQRLLLEVLGPEALAADPHRAEVRAQVQRWGARAAIDSVGYRLVRGWRLAVIARVLAPFAARAKKVDARFEPLELSQVEDAAWTLVTQRPAHLLDPVEKSWGALLLASLDDVLKVLPEHGKHLERRTWGERNTAAIRHPLSGALPVFGALLDMAVEPLPGDGNMPRAQGPSFGASERFVVSPGREAEGLFHMPGGQSGHPLSPHYRAGHEAWARGEPTPFLPGPMAHRLVLTPG